MAVLVLLALFLSLIGYSSGTYCICREGLGDSVLQKTIDFACGAGGDCRAIAQNGVCYQPNTVKAHCDYAANSYFQNKGQTPTSCDFSGTATPSTTLPTTVVSGCNYPTSASQVTPSTSSPTITPGTTAGGGTTPGTTTGIFSPTGMSPTGSVTGTTPNGGQSLLQQRPDNFLSLTLTLIYSGLLVLWG